MMTTKRVIVVAAVFISIFSVVFDSRTFVRNTMGMYYFKDNNEQVVVVAAASRKKNATTTTTAKGSPPLRSLSTEEKVQLSPSTAGRKNHYQSAAAAASSAKEEEEDTSSSSAKEEEEDASSFDIGKQRRRRRHHQADKEEEVVTTTTTTDPIIGNDDDDRMREKAAATPDPPPQAAAADNDAQENEEKPITAAAAGDVDDFDTTLLWEQVGKCDLRPADMTPDCCFGGVSVFREWCQNHSSNIIVDQVNARTREYQKQHPQYYYNNNNKCDACQIGDYLMKYNLTLTFQGDSFTDQSFVGLRCALLRRGIAKMEYYVMKWRHRNSTMMWKYGLWDIRVARLIVPKTGEYSGRIVYAKAYRRPRQDGVPLREVDYIVQNSDLIVFDHGLHWQPRLLQNDFTIEMTQYLNELTQAQEETGHELALVAWRETGSQHFNLQGGYYWPGKEGKRGCIPHSSVNESLPALADIFDQIVDRQHGNNNNALHWPLMKKAAESADYGFWNVQEQRTPPITLKPQLAYIPFRDFTVPLHFLHPHAGDCTHYCNTPNLWHSVWRGLRVAMDGVQLSQYIVKKQRRGDGFVEAILQGKKGGAPSVIDKRRPLPPPAPAAPALADIKTHPAVSGIAAQLSRAKFGSGGEMAATADDAAAAAANDDGQQPAAPVAAAAAATTTNTGDTTSSSPLLKSIKKNYKPESYDPLENFEWERPGKCDKRPPGMPEDCCFGGVKVFREFCQPRNPEIIDKLTERDRQYRKEHHDFYKPLADETAEPCDACRIADHLIAHNLTLTFQGDSVSDQSFVGLRCALWRRGYKMDWLVHAGWKRNSTLFWKYGLQDTRIASLVVDESLPERHPNRTSGRIVYTKVYRRPVQSNYKEVSYMASQSDFLIFDHGLHWQPRQYWTDMLPEMTQMLAEYHETDDLSHLKLLAWRETSTQHWNLPGGYWWPGREGVGCYDLNKVNRSFDAMDQVMINYGRDGHTLHVPIMRRAAEANNMTFVNVMDAGFASSQPPPPAAAEPGRGRRELVWLPFRNYSIPLWYSHSHGKDCTHYCNSYHLWTSVWRGLRLAVDRAMKQQHDSKRRGGAFDHSPFW